MAHESSRIDPCDTNRSLFLEKLIQGGIGAKVTGNATGVANNETGCVNIGAFEVFFIDSVVADLRIGHRDHLSPVAGVGQNFLIAGHRSIKNYFAGSRTAGP